MSEVTGMYIMGMVVGAILASWDSKDFVSTTLLCVALGIVVTAVQQVFWPKYK